MKWLLLICLILLIAWQSLSIKKTSALTQTKKEQLIKDTIHFAQQVQPILVKHCSPCHFTGGKMYMRMPFDKDSTIINHETGILKRIKDKEENLIIKSFVLQNKNGSSNDKPSKESVNNY
jgi:uncharacterized membrane protein